MRTLAARVVLVCVLTTMAGELLTAIIAGVIAEQLVSVADDARLRGSAEGLRAELGAVPDDLAAANIASEENEEIAPSGLRLTLFKDRAHIGGADGLSGPPPIGCSSRADRGAAPIRVCAENVDPYLVAYWSSTAASTNARRSYGAGALCAIVISGLIALAFSRSLASWAVRPLSALRHAIASMSREAPRGIDKSELGQVAEVDSIAEALNDLVRKLAASLSESRRFAAGAAHELRTPLAMVSAELELLGETSPPAAAQALQRTLRTLAGLSTRVDNLLVLASVDENTHRFLREAVVLAEVIEASMAAMPAEKRKRISLHNNEAAAALTLRGDAELLQMAIDNALDNALKFSGVAPVTVRLTASSAEIICEIRDSGPGVPRSERERVFEPFYRAAAVSSNGVRGYGLGLALIAHVARAHGGAASFVEVETGALLRLTFPLWRS